MKYGKCYAENFSDIFEHGEITIDGVDYTCDGYYYNGGDFVLINHGKEYFNEEEEFVSEVIEVTRLSSENEYFIIIDNDKINVFTIEDFEL